MKVIDWMKWGTATVIAATTMTVSSLSYFDERYALKQKVLDEEKRVDKIEDGIYRELTTIKEDIKKLLEHGSNNRTGR